ncbi:MAG: amidohydrolase family protein [Candidatus Heimdallarchaeota archaeon]|nr:amidohydrolase family protein [Candidatus Heimdallarchaeota archaeon]
MRNLKSFEFQFSLVMLKDTILEADMLVTCDGQNSVINDAAIYVSEGLIVDIGSRKKIHEDYSAKQIIEGQNKIILPGLVNTHSHSVQTFLRGKADDYALLDWLRQVVLPGEANYTSEEVYFSSLLGFAEMIRTGTTTTNDMLTTHHSNLGIEAAVKSGIRARIGKMLMDVESGFPAIIKEETETVIETTRKQIDTYHQTQDGRIKYSLNARFLLSCSPKLMRLIVETQHDYEDLMLHTHASESQAECSEVKKMYNDSYIRALNNLNALGSETILAHGIWLDDAEFKLIQESNTRITHNPSSNCKLASGICDVLRYHELGVLVGIGTDGPPCNNNFDMFRDMRLATFLQKVKHLNEQALPASRVLKMATIDGAKAINWDKEIGSIEKGKKADMIMIDIDQVNALPLYDPISHLIYSSSGKDVTMTMVGGKILYHNGQFKTLDFDKVKTAAKKFQENWS